MTLIKRIPTDIPTIIKWTVKEYGGTPYEINNGLCEEFAMDIIDRMGGYKKDLFELCDGNFSEDLPGHVWIYYRGKHYDAETPHGVKSWKMLPLFKRLMKKPVYATIIRAAQDFKPQVSARGCKRKRKK